MTLKQIEAFVKIANNKSFTLAAKELYITQPTVSAYINSMEDELGVRVFDRTTKEVQLSEEGKQIYLYAKEILELTNKIQGAFSKDVTEHMAKQIVISTSSIPGQFLLPEILVAFEKKFKGVKFKIKETDSSGVIKDIEEHMADIGFAGTEINSSKCKFIPFYDDELVIVTQNSEKYRELAKISDLKWLKDENFIMRESGSGTRKEAIKILEKCGICFEELYIKAIFDKTISIINSVVNGLGIAMMSRLAVQNEIADGKLLAFKIEGGAYRKIYMVTEKKTKLSGTAKDMIGVVNKLYDKVENCFDKLL